MAWENLHPNPPPTKAAAASTDDSDNEPKLLKFLGKPDDLSPKARLKMYV